MAVSVQETIRRHFGIPPHKEEGIEIVRLSPSGIDLLKEVLKEQKKRKNHGS